MTQEQREYFKNYMREYRKTHKTSKEQRKKWYNAYREKKLIAKLKEDNKKVESYFNEETTSC